MMDLSFSVFILKQGPENMMVILEALEKKYDEGLYLNNTVLKTKEIDFAEQYPKTAFYACIFFFFNGSVFNMISILKKYTS